MRSKTGRTISIKKCVICGNDFEFSTVNSRVQCCGTECGRELARRNNKRIITKEEFIIAVNKCKTAQELCNELQCSLSALYRCEKRYGITFNRRPLNIDHIRDDGYFNYKSERNHRRIYEKHYNISLSPKQQIHHIDNDKSNNSISNLFLTESVAEHNKIHLSMERIGFDLFKRGIIGFNKRTKKYFIKCQK